MKTAELDQAYEEAYEYIRKTHSYLYPIDDDDDLEEDNEIQLLLNDTTLEDLLDKYIEKYTPIAS